MRTKERLEGLRDWMQSKLCEGRSMKSPAADDNMLVISRKEPKTYLAYYPARLNAYGEETEENVAPAILISPIQGAAKNQEEERFDRYNKIFRAKGMGQRLNVCILFVVYEPGIRMPGFVTEGVPDMTKIAEGTEEGLFTLTDWMDDCVKLLLQEKTIPGTDLYLLENEMTYGPYTESGFISDKRPYYYGFVNASFACYADEGVTNTIDQMLN